MPAVTIVNHIRMPSRPSTWPTRVPKIAPPHIGPTTFGSFGRSTANSVRPNSNTIQ
jgi:hypothetical protein